MPAADLVGFITRSTWLPNFSPLIATGRPFSKLTVMSSASIATAGSQCLTPMIGSTISRDSLRCSRVFASWVAPQMLASVEYAFSLLAR